MKFIIILNNDQHGHTVVVKLYRDVTLWDYCPGKISNHIRTLNFQGSFYKRYLNKQQFHQYYPLKDYNHLIKCYE